MVDAILAVWTTIMTWFTTSIPTLTSLFYTAPTGSATVGTLTFFGLLAVVGLGISVFFLILGFVQKFLHLRG